jgi:hypothetical protein
MKVGDLVKTKVPGFGTGKTSRTGIVIDANVFGPNSTDIGVIKVLHPDGTTFEWYPWQLNKINDAT